MSDYTQGDLVELPAEFRDAAAGALIDPTSVKLRVVYPDNTTITWTYPVAQIVRSAVGKYVGLIDTTAQAGDYQWEWVLTGNLQGVEPSRIWVEAALPGAAAYRRVRGRLARLVAAAKEPLLDHDDLDELLTRARRPDAAGLLPSAATWAPTYDLRAAAADAWELKASRAAGDYDFSAAGKSFSRHQVFEHCMAMSRQYRRGGSASAPLSANLVELWADVKLLQAPLK